MAAEMMKIAETEDITRKCMDLDLGILSSPPNFFDPITTTNKDHNFPNFSNSKPNKIK